MPLFHVVKSCKIQTVPKPAKQQKVLMKVNSCSTQGELPIHHLVAHTLVFFCKYSSTHYMPGTGQGTDPACTFPVHVISGNTKGFVRADFPLACCSTVVLILQGFKYSCTSSPFSVPHNRSLLQNPDCLHELTISIAGTPRPWSRTVAHNRSVQLINIASSLPGWVLLHSGLV